MNIDELGRVYDIEDFDPFALPYVQLSEPHATLTRFEGVAAIYFVVDNGELVYIGQSDNLKGRICNHRYNMFKDKCESMYYLELDKSIYSPYFIKRAERAFIAYFQPKLNKYANPKYQTKQETQ